MKRIHSHIPEPLWKRLASLSKKKDVKVAELIRLALDEYLKRESKNS